VRFFVKRKTDLCRRGSLEIFQTLKLKRRESIERRERRERQIKIVTENKMKERKRQYAK
jgi:hypothetical protein